MSQLAKYLLERLREIPVGQVGKRADLAGISREQMTRWRRGKLPVNPTLETLERLARALDLRISLTDAAGSRLVAEAGADYDGAPSDARRDVEQEQRRLRARLKRLETKLGLDPDDADADAE